MKTYKGLITKLEPNQIFVFGSNPQGRHGAGAAYWAYKNAGAVMGEGYGLHGQSYAIYTKDLTKNTHPSILPNEIIDQIGILYLYARTKAIDKEFLIAYSSKGINLSGYTSKQLAAMFNLARFYTEKNKIPDNIIFEFGFSKMVNS